MKYFLNGRIRGKSIYRTIYFIPMIAAPAAVTMVWKWLYNNQYGLINHLLQKIGLGKVYWIDDPNVAIISIIITGVWSSFGYSMVLFLAGLQEIPRDYYEASSGNARHLYLAESVYFTFASMLILSESRRASFGA